MQAIAYSIEDGLRKKGERPLGMEGVTEGRWALIDYVDVVVHIFLEPVRSFYDLEGLWAEAPVTEVKDRPAPKKEKPEPKAKPAAAKALKKPAAAKTTTAKPAKKTAAPKAVKKTAPKTGAGKKKKSE